MTIDRSACPDYFLDYILYISVTKNLAARTVQEYYMDIRLFLKYIRMMKEEQFQNVDDLESIPILDMSIAVIDQVRLQDIYNYLYYISEERENHDRARSRKVSALRSFFGYLYFNQNIIHQDPTERLEMPTPHKSLPKYLTLEESQNLLKSLDTQDFERDYCILTLFLNCGIRLSELVGINLTDINFEECKMRVLGKGSKERTVYLNHSCMEAINTYLGVRPSPKENDEKALFLSRFRKRISKRRVQQVVENALTQSNLNGKGLSTHKLRHTAATLMYQYGGVDTLTLKEVLGHASIATTEIYTHLSNPILKNATDSSPLANFDRGDTAQKSENTTPPEENSQTGTSSPTEEVGKGEKTE